MLLYLTQADETKMRVFHAIDRPIEELTVEILCRKAGISKPTFYRHFESKYDVPIWFARFMCLETLDKIGRTLTWEEGLRGYFEIGIAELEHLRYTRAAPDMYEKIIAAREKHRCRIIEETLCMHGVEVTPLLSRAIKGYVKVELHFSEERVEPGQSQNIDEIVTLATSFIPPVLYDALKEPLAQA